MYQKYIKRFLDIVLSLLCILIASPVFVIVYILVRIKLGSPAIFKQDRPGYKNQIFTLYKFRTMTDARDEEGNLLPDGVRLTRFGRFLRSTSLDELPEFFNILFGDMSFIGPRPLLTNYIDLYSHRQSRRHDVLPGLTGLAQVSGRNAISWEEKFEFDLEYGENGSFLLDVKIFFYTILKVFKRSDIYATGNATVEAFGGTKRQRYGQKKDRILKILFTSAGDKVELIQSFLYAAGNLGLKVRIYGADASVETPGMLICHEKRQVPLPSDENYGEALLAICKKEKIQMLIPTSREETVLSKYKVRLEKVGTCLLLSDSSVVDVCNNPEKRQRFLEEYQINDSSGRYESAATVEEGARDIWNVQLGDVKTQYGKEQYEIDILCDMTGSPIYITPRVEEMAKNEEVSRYRVVQNDTLIQMAKRIIEGLHPIGPMTLYAMKNQRTGEVAITDMKPFFSSHVPIAIKAGADEAEAILKMMFGEKLSYQPKAADDSIVFGRYEYSICVNAGHQIEKIHHFEELTHLGPEIEAVIFDLDDTLYSQKEYMRSGFREVSKHLPQVEHCFNKLCVAFEKGKMPIETLLHEENIYTDELLEECLTIFRNHKPEIVPYDGVVELFHELHRQKKSIGIITDGMASMQNAKLDSLGIRSLVDEIILTDELAGHGDWKEFSKPNDIAYLIMKKRLGIACRNIAYVGDDREIDFVAPGKLGMKCFWFINEDRLYD